MSSGVWPSGPQAVRDFRSFDGGVSVRSRMMRPDRYSFFKRGTTESWAIPLGAGLSYVAAGFGQGVTSIDCTCFDRILDFDSQTGEIEVECGVTLDSIYRFLTPRGFFLAIQPGHGSITVGGCIGADVHGKNQAKDGTFINQVVSLRLFHPLHGILDLSPDCEGDLFRATCGGFGLTGVVVSVRLGTKPLPSSVLEWRTVPVVGLTESHDLLVRLSNEDTFVYAWYDLAAFGSRRGHGYVTSGSFLESSRYPPQKRASIRDVPLSAQWREILPIGLLNPFTVPIMNFGYSMACTRHGAAGRVELYEALFPLSGKEIYFRLYGRGGFHEQQVLIPHESFAEFVTNIREYSSKHRVAISLTSAKVFKGASDLLRFAGDGICLALDMPRRTNAQAFLAFVDGLVTRLHGRPNIIKDSRLSRSVVEACYPQYDRFRTLLREFDPSHLFRSELSERLEL